MGTSVVFFWSLLLALVVSTRGRVAVSDVDLVNKNEPAITPPESKITIVNVGFKFNNITGLDAITKVLSELRTNFTTRKRCSHHTTDVSDNEIQLDDNEPCEPVKKTDNGTALILTPFIKEGRALEGRKASEVDPELFLGVKSHSGFFTVNETYDSNVFFWYFPVDKKPVNETPWIVWLQGGPGASSMAGLFDEIGPFMVEKGKLERNPYTWLQNHSLVFIENPVGTGYSFTNHKDGLVTDMATYAAHLYSTIKQFVEIFPELRTAPLYVAGESYAGKYVPALATEIHSHLDQPGGNINLKGIMVGNGFIEPSMLITVPETFQNFGLLDQGQVEILRPLNEAFVREIASNNSVKAKMKWTQLVSGLLMLSSLPQGYNFLSNEMAFGHYEGFLSRSEVKRALHVGDIHHSFVNVSVNYAMAPDFLSNARPLYETLLNHYQVLVYCGQLDQLLACPIASKHYSSWQWDRSASFRNATRVPLTYRRKLAGYFKSGGGLTEAVVRGAGHMAPQDRPAPVRRLVAAFTHARAPDSAPRYDVARIREFVDKASRT